MPQPEQPQQLNHLFYEHNQAANERLQRAYLLGFNQRRRHGDGLRAATWLIGALCALVLLLLFAAKTGMAQTTMPAFQTPQMNSDLFVGQPGQQTIQQTVTFACGKGVGMRVVIPTGATPSDTVAGTAGCALVTIEDRRSPPSQVCNWIGAAYACTGKLQAAMLNGGQTLGMNAAATVGADNTMTESWYGDMVCNVPSGGTATALPIGWDIGANQKCGQGFVSPATNGTWMNLARNLQFSGGTQPAVTQFTVTARMLYQAGSNTGASIGFNSGTAKVANTDATKHVLATINGSGFAIDNQGVITQLLPVAGATSGVPGTTDSGFGLGWSTPPSGTYDVTLTAPGDGTLMLSLVMLGTPQNSYSFRLANQTFPSPLTNLEVDAFNSTYDRIGNVGYSIGGPRASTYGMPHRSGYYNTGMMWRFPSAGNTWAWVPPAYDRRGNNKWIVTFHGYGETGNVIQQQYLPATSVLMQQGYTIVSLDNTLQNCYGNAQCMADTTAALQTVQSALSLAPQPYVMCDSMGCLTELNAVTQGAIQPKAGVLFCGNTNMLWDYQSGGAAAAITTAYNITSGNPYSTALAGFDPQLAAGQQLAALTTVPWMLFSSPGDTVVLKTVNADLFAAKIAAAGGSATVIATTGNHEDASNFQGATVANFFNTH